ncbi:MAG TPA: oligosaccharide flippase family protein [Terriglobia bacterium]|nr:oligosaccharide flippase family protein [Terriglobia bacterium]
MNFAKIYGRGKVTFDRLLRGGTLRAKAMRGGVLLGGGSIAEQASRFARNMILTRLLAPSAFGAMAIVMSSSAIVGSLTEVGLRAAVIQNPRGGEKAYLDAGWWMGMGRAIMMYLIIFAMGPWLARFYGNAELSALLRVALLSTLFDGAMSPRSILPQKEMKFGRWTAISNGGAICGVILTVILSFFLRDVWALAIGTSSENGFRCLLSYILCPGLPSLRWDRYVARDLYKFSRGVFGLPFLNLIFSRMDIFVLGKLYSATALGLYSMAVYLVQTPSVFLTAMLVQTLFPSFAHVQEDKERINRILVEVTSWGILLGLPGVVVIYFCAPSLLTVIYGVRYAAAAGPLAVAATVVFLNVLNVLITIVFNGMGVPALHRRAVTASAVVMLIAIYPACKLLGVVGGQVAALLAIIVSYLLQVIRMRGLTGLDLFRYGKAFVPAALVSGGILGVGLGARFLGLATKPLANIALGAGACIIAYALCVPTFLRIKQTA